MDAKLTGLDAKKILKRYGLDPGGRAQKEWTSMVQSRIGKYLPVRNYRSIINAVDQGTTDQSRKIVVEEDYSRYLYYGKAMAGKPKKATSKDLVYTKNPNAQAGPYWDRRLVQNEIQEMERDMKQYLEEHKK